MDFCKHSWKNMYRGHKIYEFNGAWFYLDNNMSVAGPARECGHCKKENTKEGHDACVGHLDSVMNACCGHGKDSSAYVQFSDGKRIAGAKALEFIESVKEKCLFANIS